MKYKVGDKVKIISHTYIDGTKQKTVCNIIEKIGVIDIISDHSDYPYRVDTDNSWTWHHEGDLEPIIETKNDTNIDINAIVLECIKNGWNVSDIEQLLQTLKEK